MSVYERFFVEGPEVASGPCAVRSGAVPAGLSGSLLRNGGGRFRIGRDRLGFYDAHGLVAGVAFRDGRAWWRAAFVETPLAREEVAAGRMTRRRTFANLPGGIWSNAFQMDPANPAGHDAYAWRGRVIAADGPGHFALDRALRTVGTFRPDPGAPRATTTAPMPQIDPVTGHLVGYTVIPGGLRPDRIGFVEVHPDGTVRRTPWIALAASPVVVHGHAFSARWYGVVELPGRLALLPALLGTSTISGAFKAPKGAVATLVLAPRGRPGPAVRVPLPGVASVLHLVNMADDGENVVIDASVYAEAPPLAAVAPGGSATSEPARLVRLVVDPVARKVLERREIAGPPSDGVIVDPRVRGAGARYLWGPVPAGEPGPVADFTGFFHGLARFEPGAEPAVWAAGDDALVSQPAFAPKRGSDAEGDGWLLAWITRADGTDVAILDASDVAAGPVCQLSLGAALPGPGHCRFAPDLLLMDDEEAARTEPAIPYAQLAQAERSPIAFLTP